MKSRVHEYKILAAAVCLMLWTVRGEPANTYTNDFTNWNGENLTLQDGDIIAGVHTNVGSFIVDDGATATVQPFTEDMFGKVIVFADSADIRGTLSADAAGYPAEQGDGAGTTRCGAGHGGRGNIAHLGVPGDVYGSATAPDTLGSGGGIGHGSHTGGAGGGAIILCIVGNMKVDGTLSAAGGNGGYRSGGGSGGSIWLAANTIEGAGMILADGGAGGSDGGGGGGGGRIAFDANNNLFDGMVRAQGQPGARGEGRHGTFNFQFDSEADLVIKADIALPPGTNWVFRSLTVQSNVKFDIQSIPGDAPDYADEEATRLRILGNASFEAGSAVTADGQGYRTGKGEGAGTVRAGAGYGGIGGMGDHAHGVPGGTYGIANVAGRLGSGGGLGHDAAGPGGGVVILEVGKTLNVRGRVSAHGGDAGYRGGGGSGGGLWLRATTIIGDGQIGADGGEGYNGGGGGGGGRIMLDYGWIDGFQTRSDLIVETLNPSTLPETLSFGGVVTTSGGAGHNSGADGSRLFRYLPPPVRGTLFLVR